MHVDDVEVSVLYSLRLKHDSGTPVAVVIMNRSGNTKERTVLRTRILVTIVCHE